MTGPTNGRAPGPAPGPAAGDPEVGLLGFPTGPGRLEVQNLGVSFGGVHAVVDVSFTAEPLQLESTSRR